MSDILILALFGSVIVAALIGLDWLFARLNPKPSRSSTQHTQASHVEVKPKPKPPYDYMSHTWR